MKVDFIKETKMDGSVIYYTKVNDGYISNSLSSKESEARVLFERIKKDGPHALEDKREVVESVEIEYNEEK